MFSELWIRQTLFTLWPFLVSYRNKVLRHCKKNHMEQTIPTRSAGGLELSVVGVGGWSFGGGEYWGQQQFEDVTRYSRNILFYWKGSSYCFAERLYLLRYCSGLRQWRKRRGFGCSFANIEPQRTGSSWYNFAGDFFVFDREGTKILPPFCTATLLREQLMQSLKRLQVFCVLEIEF